MLNEVEWQELVAWASFVIGQEPDPGEGWDYTIDENENPAAMESWGATYSLQLKDGKLITWHD